MLDRETDSMLCRETESIETRMEENHTRYDNTITNINGMLRIPHHIEDKDYDDDYIYTCDAK